MGEYRRENVKHLFPLLMGEEVCQLDILARPSWGDELTFETIPISIGDPYPQLYSEVLNIYSMHWRACIHMLLYVHSNIGAIDLMVSTQVISHSVHGHHKLTTVHIKLDNRNSALLPICAMDLVVTS